MFTTRVVVDSKKFKDLKDFIQAFPDLVNETAVDVVDAKREKWLAKLRYTPPKRTYPGDYPLEWTSERQRKAYFASDGFGHGIPYQRTGRYANSFRLYPLVREYRIQIRVENTWENSAYVGGRFSRDNRGKKKQQRFHQLTGWPDNADTSDQITTEYISDFNDAFSKFF